MRIVCSVWLPIALLVGACTTPTLTPIDAALDAHDAVAMIETDTTDRADISSRDVPTAPTDAGVCPMGTMVCGIFGCIDLQRDINHCGACGMECPEVANGIAGCVRGLCAPTCNAGFEPIGANCLAPGVFPRPIAPISLGDVTLLRPTLRWQLPAGAGGAVIDLCRDRACTMVIESLRAMGTSGRPTRPLPANSVVFWRLRAAVGLGTGTSFSPTWLFHVPAMDNSNAIDTSANPHLDLNGDGFDDVVVGVPGAYIDGLRGVCGAANVHHGSVMGIRRDATLVLEGVAAGDNFGHSVAGAGDVNGDGFGDLVVGAPRAAPNGILSEGMVSVFHGSAMGVSMSPARVLDGGARVGAFGSSVSSAGDVNGDGFADLVVGAPLASPGARVYAGMVSVFHGSAMGVSMAPARVLEGGEARSQFGDTVSSAGDLNGDGFSDLVVGSHLAFPSSASVFHGSAMGVSMAPTRVLLGGPTRDYFGVSVSSAGDVNGDGYSDLIVGAFMGISRQGAESGTAHIFNGSAMGLSMTPVLVLDGENRDERFGWSVSSAGDVNIDGFADLVVGAVRPNSNGSATVFLGTSLGTSVVRARVLRGMAAGDQFGRSVSRAGDVNGDGYADIVVGAPFASPGGRMGAGTASVYYGGMMDIPMNPAIVLEGAAANNQFGYSVASLVDATFGRRNRTMASVWIERFIVRAMKRG